MDSPSGLGQMVSRLFEARDDEIRAEQIAAGLLGLGPRGVDALISALRESSGKTPKLAVAILNAFRSFPDKRMLQQLSQLIEEGSLAQEDASYALSILSDSGSPDPSIKRKLVHRLKRTTDPVGRSELLAEIVRLRVTEATDLLTDLVPADAQLDYSENPERASREEMVRFALLALGGRHGELESIVLDPESHPYRRSAALEFLVYGLRGSPARLISRAADSDCRELRVMSMRLAGSLTFRDAVQILIRGLQDADGWVSFVAAMSTSALLDRADSLGDPGPLLPLVDALKSAERRRGQDKSFIRVARRSSRRLTLLLRGK